MNFTEDNMIERSVNALIEEEGRPLNIVLFRPQRTRNARGGWDMGEPIELDPQVFRLVPFKRRLTLEFREGPTDKTTQVDYIMTGKVGSDVQIDDYFEHEDEVWRVDGVSVLHFHRTQPTVVRRRERV